MLYIVIGLLLIMVIIFGVSSGMQSFASAQQAQATIEVAQVAQVSAWGNLISILTIAMVVLVTVALVAAVSWFLYRRSAASRQRSTLNSGRSTHDSPSLPGPGIQTPSLEMLIQLETLRMLRSMIPPAALPSGNNEHPRDDEPLQWLK